MRRSMVLLLAFALPAIAQDTGWERLKSLQTGQVIWVEYAVGTQTKHSQGPLVSWDENNIGVQTKKDKMLISRPATMKVATVAGRNHGKGAAFGAAVAALPAVLCGAGQAGTGLGSEEKKNFFIGLATCAAVGAAIGGAIGRTQKTIVYEAPPRK